MQSLIIPIYNGSKWINRCFDSIAKQTAYDVINCEICICNDASLDNTLTLLKEWKVIFENKNVTWQLFNNESEVPGGGS